MFPDAAPRFGAAATRAAMSRARWAIRAQFVNLGFVIGC